MSKCCGHCRFWDSETRFAKLKQNDGLCRVDCPCPIQTDSDQDATRVSWPITNYADWCGEFKASKQQSNKTAYCLLSVTCPCGNDLHPIARVPDDEDFQVSVCTKCDRHYVLHIVTTDDISTGE